MFIYKRLVLIGAAIWMGATAGLRLEGQHVLRADAWKGTLILFAVSFPLMALVVRRLCKRFQLPREQWLAGAFSIALPTLLLDPFSSAFFPTVFPNMSRDVAGVFGGWMLWCCAGAFVGVSVFGERDGAKQVEQVEHRSQPAQVSRARQETLQAGGESAGGQVHLENEGAQGGEPA
jgi:hypothetical protein